MNRDLLKYALIAAGVYMLYRYIQDQGGLSHFLGSPMVGGTGPAPSTGTQPGHAATPAPPAAPGVSTAQKVAQAAAAAGEPPNLNFDGWCWYFAKVTGRPCPDPAAIYAGDRTAPIDVNTWWAAMAAAGMNGLGFISPAFTQVSPAWLN